MSDRLKQIWSGFEHTTTRHLTGNGIDNIHVPHRREWRTDDNRFLGERFEAPAERAFAALKWKLAEDEKKYSKSKATKQVRDETRYAYGELILRHAKELQFSSGTTGFTLFSEF